MTFRLGRLFFLGWLIVTLSGAALATAFPQGDSRPQGTASRGTDSRPGDASPADRVKSFATAAREITRYGGAATPIISSQAKTESSSTAGLLNAIGQALKEKATAEGTDSAPSSVEPAAKRLVTSARDMLALRDKVLPALKDAIADAGNADVKDYLIRAESRVYVALCIAAMRVYITADNKVPGTFDGMFTSLEKYDREKIADGFLDVFRNPTQTGSLRQLAGEGLAQMGSARHVPALKSMLANPNENSSVLNKAVFTLARLGDRTLVDKRLKDIAAKMDELKKPDMSAQEGRTWASGYYESAMLSQNIHDNEAAIKFYEQYLRALEELKEKNPSKDTLISVYYNLACMYSTKGDVETGFKYLDKSFEAGWTDFKWANTDGDLANLRKDQRFKALIEKWESGKKTEAPASRPS